MTKHTMQQASDYIEDMGRSLRFALRNRATLEQAARNGDCQAVAVVLLLDMALRRGRRSDQVNFHQACEHYQATKVSSL